MENEMNYEDMTGAQINEAVTNAVTQNLINELDSIDYCNDWGYGGLIIQNAKISIEYDQSSDVWIAHQGDYLMDKYVSDCKYRHQYENKNPLRAAMIVFLMMQDEL